MGPLVPLLFLAPVFVSAAWLFRSVAVVGGVPLFSAAFGVAALLIGLGYYRHYARFAKHDPDRLQSEEYRYETARMQMIAAKELRRPMPADRLPLGAPTENPAELQSPDDLKETPESAVTEEERES